MRHRDAVRQPWYPVEERYGLVFAYLGPPQKKPVLPRYDNLENVGADEWLWVSIGGFGATGDASLDVVPHSWLHLNDNIMDPFHVHVLHSTLSVIQFHAQFALMPKVEFFPADHGVCYSAVRQLDGGQSALWQLLPRGTRRRLSHVQSAEGPDANRRRRLRQKRHPKFCR